jgi:DNA-binding response OmpR family regulator
VRVLIAEDDPISRRILLVTLQRAGHEVVETEDGDQAWELLSRDDAPRMAILDWMMPGKDGIDVCRLARRERQAGRLFVILLTAKGHKDDVVEGLDAGADDYVTKPFDREELLSRVRAGQRTIELECALEEKVRQLEDALVHVKTLQGLLPICMHCKKIRDDSETWHRLEEYIEDRSHAVFTHSLCEDCLAEHYPGSAGARSPR